MIAVLTSTCRYGGIDIAAASVERQGREDLTWIVGDELLSEREHVWRDHAPCPLRTFDTRKLRERTGHPRSLCASNNEGLRIARELDADMLVLLNDYIWAPPGGIDQFLAVAAEHPDSLLTGATSFSEEPTAKAVTDPQGLYSIFAKPYVSRPWQIGWSDCRLDVHIGVDRCDAVQWEANWAAIPRAVLHDETLNFDLDYDRGQGYDNQAFAAAALQRGYGIWIDCENHAISLPHNTYWPGHQEHLETINNRSFHEQRLRDSGVAVP